ncbi:hypothetical protein ACUNV4_03340 [Granulosicoccus sp. 3-233]|uniref:hypothetical protein n=1 Tax=Granulosicoccus sp. 3-233 TaxID=3417969 RepID=UPI003D3332A1
MEITLIGLVVTAFALASLVMGERALLFLCVALLPFGMASIANIHGSGNLSIPAAEAVAGLLVLGVIHPLLGRQGVFALSPLMKVRAILMLFCLYSVLAAIFLVRAFAGDVLVFPLARDMDGLRLDSFFRTFVIALRPSSSNLAQTFYLLLSVASFFAFTKLLHKHSVSVFHRALLVCATLNIILGVMDILGLDSLLAFVRTANYALLTHQETASLPRAIGGFPEPAAFGTFTATLFIYFSRHFVLSSNSLSAALAMANGMLAVMTFSSTSYAGISFGFGFLCVFAWLKFMGGRANVVEIFLLHLIPFTVVLLVLTTLLINIGIDYNAIIDSVLTNKLDSDSARERAAWAAYALGAFWETYGLGVGPGSLRGNGWASVYLGSLGLPGTVLMVAFLWVTLFASRVRSIVDREERDISLSAKTAAMTMLVMLMITATTPNPGILLMLLVAIVFKSQWADHSRPSMPKCRDAHANALSSADGFATFPGSFSSVTSEYGRDTFHPCSQRAR